jgi:hypothetical protein
LYFLVDNPSTPADTLRTSDRAIATIIRTPAEDTPKTLQNALKKSVDANRILKERKKKALTRGDY